MIFRRLRQALRKPGERRRDVAAHSGQSAAATSPGLDALLREGHELYEAARYAELERCCETILAREPENADACYLLGRARAKQGRDDEALDSLTRAIASRPDFARAQLETGNILRRRGDIEAAIEHYRRSLVSDSELAEAHYWLGRALRQVGRQDEAAAAFEKAIEYGPDFSEAHYHVGLCYRDLEKWQDALDSLALALHFDPHCYEALFDLAATQMQCGQVAGAIENYKKAIAARPGFAPAYCNLGRLYFNQGDYEEALGYYRQGLDVEPDNPVILGNVGLALIEQSRMEEAEVYIRSALDKDPGSQLALAGLASILVSRGEVGEAIAAYSARLEANAELGDERLSRATLLLLNGEFRRGWEDYSARWLTRACPPRPFHYPVWDGSPPAGRTILVYGEQGLGDEIMFSSCLPDLLAQAGHCLLECDSRLERLFSRSFPQATVHGGEREDDTSWLSSAPAVDMQTAIGSLPRVYRNSWSDFPQHDGYLHADPGRVAFWRARLDALGPGMRVGISWRGGTRLTRQTQRSIPLSQWLPILSLPGIRFVNLQYGQSASELAELADRQGITVHTWQEALDDFDETAALATALDLVISVQTTLIHLGGALGRPVWVMVPAIPEWRYLREGERIPWYPSVSVIRQQAPGMWGEVLAEVAARLSRLSLTGE